MWRRPPPPPHPPAVGSPLAPPPAGGGGGGGGGGGRRSRYVAPPTSPSQPCGLGPSLSPLKGGEGLVSAGIILVERDASRAIEFSSPDSPARAGEGRDGGWGGR